MNETAHLYLSPHLDDAILSCGGAIATLVQRGASVTILTIFAGEPTAPYSSLATKLHALWGNPPNLIALRRAEDIAAATLLGAHVEHADLLDGLYRRDRDGNHLYADKAGPFGARQTDDIPLSARITALVQARTVSRHVTCHLPLAIGGHVDHLIVFDTAALLAAEGYKVCYYEDIPYAENPRLVRQRSAAFQGWNPILDEFNEPHLAAKLNACAYYRSQLWSLFGGETAMRAKLAAHAQRTGTGDLPFAERSWYLRKPT